MATTERKASSEGSDFLIDVARSIGSTLGTVAAKVNSVTSASHSRPTTRTKTRTKTRKLSRKKTSTTRTRAARSVRSGPSHKMARRTRTNRKKSSK